jgi:acyl-CoA synthetase (AMP-forming)/AMP-acid ligase II
VAFIVASAAAADLPERVLARCREELSAFKVPRRVVLVDDLPRAALNKVAKGRLRQDLATLD